MIGQRFAIARFDDVALMEQSLENIFSLKHFSGLKQKAENAFASHESNPVNIIARLKNNVKGKTTKCSTFGGWKFQKKRS